MKEIENRRGKKNKQAYVSGLNSFLFSLQIMFSKVKQ